MKIMIKVKQFKRSKCDAWTAALVFLACLIHVAGCEEEATSSGAASCTVEDTSSGAIIKCSDGSEAVINDGANGERGKDGETGEGAVDGVQNGSRLIATTYSGADGSGYVSPQFYDTKLKIYCTISIHADNSYRCMPTVYQATVSTYFSDPNCMTELAQDLYSSSFSTPPVYAIENIGLPQEGRSYVDGLYRYKVFRVGNRYLGTVYSKLSDGTCASATFLMDFYTIGSEVSSSEFVKFSVFSE